jgi:sensor domain CHASE-containing protein
MQPADAVAAIFVFAAMAAMVVGVAHYWYKARTVKLQPNDAEKRLARLEVAIDDMTAELVRVSEGQQILTKLLADRSSESIHARS